MVLGRRTPPNGQLYILISPPACSPAPASKVRFARHAIATRPLLRPCRQLRFILALSVLSVASVAILKTQWSATSVLPEIAATHG